MNNQATATPENRSETSAHQAMRLKITEVLTSSENCRRQLRSLMPENYDPGIPEYHLADKKTLLPQIIATVLIYGGLIMYLIVCAVTATDEVSMSEIIETVLLLCLAAAISLVILVAIDMYGAKSRTIFCTKHGLQQAQKSLNKLQHEVHLAESELQKEYSIWSGFLSWKGYLQDSLSAVIEIEPTEVPYKWCAALYYNRTRELGRKTFYFTKNEYRRFVKFVMLLRNMKDEDAVSDDDLKAFARSVLNGDDPNLEFLPEE